jgi:hypothetical protein
MSLWGNKDLVYSDGTIAVNLDTKTVTGTVGVTTFTSSVSSGDVITVGAGATYGYAVIIGITSTTLSIASTANFVSGLTTVPAGTTYFVSQEPIYTLGDSTYRAPESKTVGYSTSPVFTGVFGVDSVEVGVAKTTPYAVTHSGWVGIITYVDNHGNLRVKHEVLVAGGIEFAAGSDAADDEFFPDPIITILSGPDDVVGIGTDEDAVFIVETEVTPDYAPLSFQWFEDTTELSDDAEYSGTTTPILTVTNDSDKDDGREYSVVIASGDTSVTSGIATITYA